MTRAAGVVEEAFEIVGGIRTAPILVSCEHATQRMPDGWSWPKPDRRFIDTHWAYDLGAHDIAEDLAESLDAACISSRFTRLLIDPNRPEGHETLFRDTADGEPIALNTELLDDAEKEQRLERLYRPYHRALDAGIAKSEAPILVSIHSFTRHYEGDWRDLEIGILYDLDERLAERVANALDKQGLHVGLNEPYSGKGGLMYSIDQHARAYGRQSIEFEVRQDLATYRGFRRDFGPLLRDIFMHPDG